MNNKILKLLDNHEGKTLAIRRERQSIPRHRKPPRKSKKPYKKTRINPFDVSTGNANPSKKLLLKISLFEKAQNKACLNIHHAGQCEILRIPAESSSSSASVRSTCTYSELDQENVEQICQVVDPPSVSLPWKRVRYQVLEAAVGSSITGHKRSSRCKQSGPRYSTSILKQRFKHKPRTSFTQTLLTSSSDGTGSIIQNIKNSSMQTVSISKVQQEQEGKKPTEFNIYDYHQKSKGVQKNSGTDFDFPIFETNVFTVIRPTKSAGSITHDSIVDLFHALSWDTHSDRHTLNSSERSLFDGFEKLPKKQSNFSQTPENVTDSNEVRLTKSDKSLLGKIPLNLDLHKPNKSYLQFFQDYLNDCKSKIRPILYGATRETQYDGPIAHKVFPVLTPSGQQIGTLVGGSILVKKTRIKMLTKYTQVPSIQFPSPAIQQFNSAVQKYQRTQLSRCPINNFQKAKEVRPSKNVPKLSTALQTEKRPATIMQDIQLDARFPLDEEPVTDTPSTNKKVPCILDSILNPDIKENHKQQANTAKIGKSKKLTPGSQKPLGKSAVQRLFNSDKPNSRELGGGHSYLRYVMRKPEVEPILEKDEIKEMASKKINAGTITNHGVQLKRPLGQLNELVEL